MSDFNTNLFWCIMGIIGGCIVSAIFYFIGKRRKILTYEIKSTTLITNEISQIPGLDITFQGKKIENLVSTEIIIRNRGNDVIEESDFASKSPLRLEITGGEVFNPVQTDDWAYMVSDSNMDLRLARDKNTLPIHFEYMKPKSELGLIVFHTGKLSLEGEMKAGKVVCGDRLSGRFVFNFLFLILFFIFVVLYSKVHPQERIAGIVSCLQIVIMLVITVMEYILSRK